MVHVRIQTWLPFTIQICLNGQEWVCRQLEREGIAHQMAENSFIQISDWARAQELADQFVRVNWPVQLTRWADQFNSLLGSPELADMSYYWVSEKVEYATDTVFTNRAALQPLYQKLLEHAGLVSSFSLQVST